MPFVKFNINAADSCRERSEQHAEVFYLCFLSECCLGLFKMIKNIRKDVVKIHTTRFGELEVDQSSIIEFPHNIIGFSSESMFVIFDHHSGPYRWLQSITNPSLAFVIINPTLILKDYYINLRDEDLAILKLTAPDAIDVDLAIAVILNFSTVQPTANLLAPLCFNVDKRLGCQVVLHNSGYSTSHKITFKNKGKSKTKKKEALGSR